MDTQSELKEIAETMFAVKLLPPRTAFYAYLAITTAKTINDFLYYKHDMALCPVHGLERIR